MALEAQGVQSANLVDFTGGMNVANAPQLLAENEYQLIKNLEFDDNSTQLVTRGGLSTPLSTYPQDIQAFFYDNATNMYLVVLVNGDIYEEDLAELHNKVGTVNGKDRPNFCKYDDKIFIASGNKLQYYSYVDHTVKIIEDSKLCNFILVRFGRLATAHMGDDNLYYSALGNPYEGGWTENVDDPSSSKWAEIGYKDDGDILAVLPIAGDIAIFKSNGKIFALSGEVDAWNLQEIGTKSDAISPESITNLSSTIVFLSKGGLQTLQTVATYGNFTTSGEIGRKINRALTKNIFEPKVFNIVRKSQLIIIPNTSKPTQAYCMQYDIGASMYFEFPAPITDMQDTQDDVIIASGKSLHRWSKEFEDDNGKPIEQELISRQVASSRRLFTRGIDFGITGKLGGVVTAEWANKKIKYTIKKPRRAINLFSVCRESTLNLKANTKIAIEYIKFYLFEK